MTADSVFSTAAVAELARSDVARALSEDVGAADLTAGLVDPDRRARATVARSAADNSSMPSMAMMSRRSSYSARVRRTSLAMS